MDTLISARVLPRERQLAIIEAVLLRYLDKHPELFDRSEAAKVAETILSALEFSTRKESQREK